MRVHVAPADSIETKQIKPKVCNQLIIKEQIISDKMESKRPHEKNSFQSLPEDSFGDMLAAAIDSDPSLFP